MEVDCNAKLNMLEVKCHGTPYKARKPLPLSSPPWILHQLTSSSPDRPATQPRSAYPSPRQHSLLQRHVPARSAKLTWPEVRLEAVKFLPTLPVESIELQELTITETTKWIEEDLTVTMESDTHGKIEAKRTNSTASFCDGCGTNA